MAPASGPPLVELRDVARSFSSLGGRVPVLEGVDLELRAGQTLLVGGSSGAGKSTLLAILAMLDDDHEGTYRFEGRPVGELSTEERSRLRGERVGVVLQRPRLPPMLTLEENVALPAITQESPADEAREQARALLDELGIEAQADQRPRELSGGQTRRAAIAQALLADPDLLVLDEPEAGLDDASVDVLVDLLESPDREDQALVLATREPRLAELADERLELEVTGTADAEPAER
jgi:ABC-type lipoprotein export system ATPase subunit